MVPVLGLFVSEEERIRICDVKYHVNPQDCYYCIYLTGKKFFSTSDLGKFV